MRRTFQGDLRFSITSSGRVAQRGLRSAHQKLNDITLVHAVRSTHRKVGNAQISEMIHSRTLGNENTHVQTGTRDRDRENTCST